MVTIFIYTKGYCVQSVNTLKSSVHRTSVRQNNCKIIEKGNEEIKLTSDVHNRPPY